MIIYGFHSVAEALNGNVSVEKVLVDKHKRSERLKKLISEIRSKGIRIQYVDVRKLNQLVKEGNKHQGIVAVISPIKYWDLEKLLSEGLEKNKNPYFVLLHSINNVGNISSIIRSAECLGVSGVIITNYGTPSITSEMIRLSAGALLRIPIAKIDNDKHALYIIKSYNILTLGTYLNAEKFINEVNLRVPHCWIFGNEQKGLPEKLAKIIDIKVKIPQATNFNSLNVSNAASICFYQSLISK